LPLQSNDCPTATCILVLTGELIPLTQQRQPGWTGSRLGPSLLCQL